jgi:glycolate oxidase FAD binding subunit
VARHTLGAIRRDGSDRRVTTAVSESTEAIGERVRDAAQRGARVRIVGAGTWLDAGRPVDSSEQLSLAGHSGIVEYTPGDLTLTACAGTTLREIHDAVSPHGQWLALDPFGSDDGTIGATIATASAGPLATRFGAPRDLTLGLEFIIGRGATVRGGGRVVKNVAGFDLTRLLTGSWGTLGVITEVTVRLHARPETEVTLGVPVASTSDEMARVRTALKRWPFVPFACEVVSESLGRQIGVGGAAVLFRLGGNGEAVAAQRRAVAELGDAREVDPDVWRALRAVERDASIVLRLSRAPADVAATWNDSLTIAAAPSPGAWASASPARGIARCVIPSGAAAQHVTSALRNISSRVIAERAPAQLWSAPRLARDADELQSRIRDAFDPQRIFNRGILGAET